MPLPDTNPHPVIDIVSCPPDKINAAFNCIKYSFRVNNLQESPAELYLHQFNLNQEPVAGDQIVITTYSGEDYTYTFKDLSDYDIEDAFCLLSGSGLSDALDSFLFALERTYFFQKNYIVQRDPFMVVSNVAGLEETLYFSTESENGLEIVTSIINAGVNATLKSNYKLIFCIEKYDGKEWCLVDEMVRDVIINQTDKIGDNFTGFVDLNIEGCLQGFDKGSVPDRCDSKPYVNVGMCKYRIGFAEIYGETRRPRVFKRLASEYFMPVRWNHSDVYHRLMPYWLAVCCENKGIAATLNKMPDTLQVCPNTPLYLSILVPNFSENDYTAGIAIMPFERNLPIIYLDYKDIVRSVSDDTTPQAEVITFPIGPQQLGLCEKIIDPFDIGCDSCWKVGTAFMFADSIGINIPDLSQQEFVLVTHSNGWYYNGITYNYSFDVVGSFGIMDFGIYNESTDTFESIGSINGDGNYSGTFTPSFNASTFFFLGFGSLASGLASGGCISNICVDFGIDGLTQYSVMPYSNTIDYPNLEYKTTTVIVDDCCDKCSFVYRNCNNVFDTIVLDCVTSEQLKIDFESIELCECEYDFSKGEFVELGTGNDIDNTLNRGILDISGEVEDTITLKSYITQEQVSQMKDFLLSRERYQDFGNRWVRVTGISGTFNLGRTDKKTKRPIELQYTLSGESSILTI